MLLAAAIQLVVGWSKSFPISIGRPGLRLLTHAVETGVLLPLVVVLGLEWGATGAACAVLVSSAVFALLWGLLYLRINREAPIAHPKREALAP
jgi:O-antigen/teichoic acid export membrane protein